MADDGGTRDTARGSTGAAVCLSRFGGPDVLTVEQVAIPQPLDDEVLVRVRAASVNPVDGKTRAGQYPPVRADKLPMILGRDLAGTIEAVGTRAHYMLSHGDRVFAFIGPDRGAQAEYVVVKAIELVAMPASIDFVSAAALGLASMTAWQGLFDHGGLTAGQRVLIHGGGGGLGHLAIQFAHAKGATVITTASGGDLDFVRSLGADQAIDYEKQDFTQAVEPVDLVLDLVGGDTQARSVGVLRDGGTLVSTIDVADAVRADAARRGIRIPDRWHAEPNAAQLGEVAGMVERGQVTVTVSETFPLAEVAAAQQRLERGGVRGKVVLTLE